MQTPWYRSYSFLAILFLALMVPFTVLTLGNKTTVFQHAVQKQEERVQPQEVIITPSLAQAIPTPIEVKRIYRSEFKEGIISQQLTLAVPFTKGPVTGKVYGTPCTGTVQGKYDGVKTIEGTMTGTCQAGPLLVNAQGIFTAVIDSINKIATIRYEGSASGVSKSGNIVIPFVY